MPTPDMTHYSRSMPIAKWHGKKSATKYCSCSAIGNGHPAARKWDDDDHRRHHGIGGPDKGLPRGPVFMVSSTADG
jgi:hypothetical protein